MMAEAPLNKDGVPRLRDPNKWNKRVETAGYCSYEVYILERKYEQYLYNLMANELCELYTWFETLRLQAGVRVVNVHRSKIIN